MNKNELKQVLKPLIKECIREVIFEEGREVSKCIFCGHTNLRDNPKLKTKSVIEIVTK